MASIFDSAWDAAARQMDDVVDDKLGDRIEYAVDGATFVIIPGFIIDDVLDPTGVNEIESLLGSRKRVKIRKSRLDQPLMTHRLRHPRLGPGIYRPEGSLPETQGRYWLFDVQKV